jgi:hypothetical protein
LATRARALIYELKRVKIRGMRKALKLYENTLES